MGAGTLGKFWLLVLALVVLGACSTTFTDETGTISVSLTSGWEEASDEDRLAVQERWDAQVIYAAAYEVDGEDLAMISWIYQTAFFIIDKTPIGWSKPITPDEARNAVAERRLLLARSGDIRDLGSGELNGHPYAKYLWRGDTTDYVAIVMHISTDQHIFRVTCASAERYWNEGRCNKAVDAVEFTGPQPPTLTPSTATATAVAADTRSDVEATIARSTREATIFALISQRQTAMAEASQIPPTPTPSPTPRISIHPPTPRPTQQSDYEERIAPLLVKHAETLKTHRGLVAQVDDALLGRTLSSTQENAEFRRLLDGLRTMADEISDQTAEWGSISYPPDAKAFHLKVYEYFQLRFQSAGLAVTVVDQIIRLGSANAAQLREADNVGNQASMLFIEALDVGRNAGVISF